jgi:aspartate carbamoyltransferase catalytic subunit
MRWDRKDLISIDQLDKEDIDHILRCAEILEPYSGRANKLLLCKGEILYCVFLEPSTRTQGSFVTAMLTLGGDVQIFNPEASSLKKSESRSDTLRTLEQFCDIVVIRDPQSGSVAQYADALDIPVINAGDGAGEHPTQALLDCFTIKRECGRLSNLNVVFMGDLKYGRTVHSLIRALRNYHGNKFYGYSPAGLEMPKELHGSDFMRIENMHDVFDLNPDVIYATRIQKERMLPEERDRFSYRIDNNFIQKLPKHARIMHPFPRVDELDTEIDNDPRVIPFKQIRYGVQTRMALLALMLGHEEEVFSLAK